MLPPMITGMGIESDIFAENFVIYFFSVLNSRKLYLGDGCVTPNLADAMANDSMADTVEALGELLQDEEFMEYLESEFCV